MGDKTIPARIKGIKVGVPLLIAVIGYLAAGPLGAMGGSLIGELGFKLVDKTISSLFDAQTTDLAEGLAKLRAKSFQVNIYDFKKKYKL